jgi:hypothetical protein
MKKLKIFLLILLCSISHLFAANVDIKSFVLDWEIKTLYSDVASKQILSFENVYYEENDLPYFLLEMPSLGEEYHFSFTNAKYASLTEQEKAIILDINAEIPQEIDFTTFRKVEYTGIREYVQILPFIYSDGIYKKLLSFDLVVATEENATQKAKFSTLAVSAHNFAENSVMNTGKWVKIQVSDNGVYKITKQQIEAAGLDFNDIRVYGYGGAMIDEDFRNARIDDLPQQSIFRASDYILFYAQGPVSWKWNKSKSIFEHTINPYSFYGNYFLASGVTSEGARTIQTMPKVELTGRTPNEITQFKGYALHEDDLINLMSKSGVSGSGKEFYGENFSSSTKTRNFSFTMPNIVSGAGAKLTFDAAVYSYVDNANRSSINVSVEGASRNYLFNNINPKLSDASYVKGIKFNTSDYSPDISFNPASSTINVNLNFSPVVQTAQGWLNYLRVTAERYLIMSGSAMNFSNAGTESSALSKYVLSGANSNIKIWEITDKINITEIPVEYSGNTLSFLIENSGNKFREFVAVDLSKDFSSSKILEAVPNQNLHALPNADFVIVSHPDFLEQAQRLAQAHQEKDNMSVLIVTQGAVFNEFSSGTPDASAIRWFMKMFYERYNRGISSKETKYLLLFGDGSFDNRGIYKNTENQNKIITYQSLSSLVETSSYVIDDYFGFLDDDEGRSLGNDRLDIGIGRFSVNTVAEATSVVDKTISYMNNEHVGVWKNKLAFLADDGDSGKHGKQADELVVNLSNSYPEFQYVKLYMDAYEQTKLASGESYPQLKKTVLDMIKKGCLLFNYTGHGGMGGFATERIITYQDITSMRNENLPLWVTATCDFSRFDSNTSTAGEAVLLNPNGAGVALFTTTRTVFADSNHTLIKKFYDQIFTGDENGNRLRLGDIIKLSKTYSDNNKLSFALLGDPALLLSYPENKVQTEKINEKNVSELDITISALSEVTLKGYITDNDANKLADFNGEITITVFDKEEQIKTLNNDKDSNGSFVFLDRPTIFVGKAELVNGEFTTTFMVPKDINYTDGFGKIVYYAVDKETNMEAHGSFSNIKVGGTDDRIIDDNKGPDIEMYLNTSFFKSRDLVNNSPLFVANVHDENGINRIGIGIGHDIVMQIDNKDWIVLNDAFEPDLGTYKSGIVSYKLENLTEGKHTLMFRVWDLLNNSSTDSFEFEVGGENMSVGILDAYTYPNPATSSATFVLTHNRPDEVLDVVLRVFDLSGRQLWSFSSEFYSVDNSIVVTEWDLTTDSGQKLQKGIYLFKVEVMTKNGMESTKTKKMNIN